MALKFVKSTEPLTVKPPIVVVYGSPGTGKTSLACTARNALLLDFDRRSAQAASRAALTVEVDDWNDVAQIAAHDAIRDVGTIVVDTVGRAIDMLSKAIIARDRRMGKAGGGLSLQGFGALKTAYVTWMRALQATGKGIVMVCHSTEQRSDDTVTERLDVTGSSRDFVAQLADVMGRVVVRDGRRLFITRPSETAFGKDPRGEDTTDLDIPNITANPNVLAEYLDDVKAYVDERNTQRNKFVADAATMRTRADACETPGALTELAVECKNNGSPAVVKMAVVDSGKARGWSWHGDKGFVEVKK